MAGWEQIDGQWFWVDGQQADMTAPDGSLPPEEQAQASIAPAQPQVPVYVPPQADERILPKGTDQYSTSSSSSNTSTPQAALGTFDKNIETGAAKVEGDVNAQANAAASALWGTSLAQQRGVIDDQNYATAQSQYQVQSDLAAENTRQQARLAEEQARLIQVEQVAHAAAERHVEQVGADYMGSVQQFAAMRVNPGQWWGNLSSGEQAGTLASVFVANFLGMRGRATTVMDSINKAIDRNMDAQVQNIDQAGKVAGMYKTVYDMTVAQSSTEEEARARMRGFYIAQLQQDIAVELSRYDAPLAQAKAAEARTALDMEFQKNLADLKAVWWDKGMTAKQLVVEQERARLQASQVSRASSRSVSAGAAKPVMGPGGPQYKEGDLAFNPRGDKPYGMFLEGTSPQVKADLRARSSSTRTLQRKLVELTEFIDANGGVWKPEWLSDQANGTEAKRMKSLWTDLAAAYSIAMNGGSRPSDFDVKNALKVVPIAGLTTRGDVTKTLDDLVRQANATYDDLAATNVRQFGDEGEAAWASQYTGARPGVGDDYEATTRTGAPVAREGEVDTFVSLAHSKQANDPKENPDPELTSKWGALKSDFPFPVPDEPPVWFYAVDEIADDLTHSDPGRQQAAREALEAYAAAAASAEDYDNGAREKAIELLLGKR